MKKLILVYGTLKRGHGNHRVMGESKLLGEIKFGGFEMKSLGGFPALIEGQKEITGEVYEVNDPITLKHIYSLESYSGVRNSPHNWYDTTDVETPFGTAEVFYMKNKEKYDDLPTVEDGVW